MPAQINTEDKDDDELDNELKDEGDKGFSKMDAEDSFLRDKIPGLEEEEVLVASAGVETTSDIGVLPTLGMSTPGTSRQGPDPISTLRDSTNRSTSLG